MSELTKTQQPYGQIRNALMATGSGLVLLACVTAQAARADDEDRPTVWIELGGQFENASAAQEPFAPPFLLKEPRPSFETVHPIDSERPPRHDFGWEGKLVFQPQGSDWSFLASVRYARANGHKVVHEQTFFNLSYGTPAYDDNYASTDVKHRASHAVLDFRAGKDVGVGMFGAHSTSTLGFGVRFAQFASKTTVDVRERPDLHTKSGFIKYFHSYHLAGDSTRSFHGVGPSLSWEGSTPFAGNPDATEFTFDWGVNAAVLFGRQKASVSHHTSGRYVKVKYGTVVPQPYHAGNSRADARSATVPNIGGFAGLSVKFPNAKVSLGYRADFFFGAMDGGIDTRKSEAAGFHGPFASVSIGLGG